MLAGRMGRFVESRRFWTGMAFARADGMPSDRLVLQPFLPGIMRGGARRLGRALARAQGKPLSLEAVDRLERLLGRHLPPEVALLFECPSCGMLARGRARGDRPTPARGINMASRVERLIPRVPVRHWVLSLPPHTRARFAQDEGLAGSITRVFVRTILAWQEHKAAELFELENPVQGGAVTVVQRGGSALNLDVHIHAMVLDGVYELPEEGAPIFHPFPDPDAADLSWISLRVRRAIARRMRKNETRPPSLAPLQTASVRHRVATGPRAGAAVPREKGTLPPTPLMRAGKTHESGGVSIHAAAPLAGGARHSLARLARYITRPPIDPGALEPGPDGKVRYRLKRPFADGTTHVEFAPHELVEKLLAMVPEGPSQRLAYHGVLAPAASQRCKIVPGQLELLPRETSPKSPAVRRRRKLEVESGAAPRCPDCDVALELTEVEQATDWLVGG